MSEQTEGRYQLWCLGAKSCHIAFYPPTREQAAQWECEYGLRYGDAFHLVDTKKRKPARLFTVIRFADEKHWTAAPAGPRWTDRNDQTRFFWNREEAQELVESLLIELSPATQTVPRMLWCGIREWMLSER